MQISSKSSIYLLLKKNPGESRSILSHANTLIKYMPIDKDTTDMISPIFDFTKMREDISTFSQNSSHIPYHTQTPQMKRMLNSGHSNNRCVSETKKKICRISTGLEMCKMSKPANGNF